MEKCRSYLTGTGCVPRTEASESLAYLVTFISLFNWSVYPVILLLVLTVLLAFRMAHIARKHQRLAQAQAELLNMGLSHEHREHQLSSLSSASRIHVPHLKLEHNGHLIAELHNRVTPNFSNRSDICAYRSESQRVTNGSDHAIALFSKFQSVPNGLGSRSSSRSKIGQRKEVIEDIKESEEILKSTPIFRLGDPDDHELEAHIIRNGLSGSILNNIHEEDLKNPPSQIVCSQEINTDMTSILI